MKWITPETEMMVANIRSNAPVGLMPTVQFY
jgi:hypothetical protein